VIRVVEQHEPVLVIRPEHPQQWAVFAYQIGNSHQPLMIDLDAIVCPDVLGMAQILTFHRIPFHREDRPFTPLGHIADHQHQLAR
jgi:urease accessory protein UreE